MLRRSVIFACFSLYSALILISFLQQISVNAQLLSPNQEPHCIFSIALQLAHLLCKESSLPCQAITPTRLLHSLQQPSAIARILSSQLYCYSSLIFQVLILSFSCMLNYSSQKTLGNWPIKIKLAHTTLSISYLHQTEYTFSFIQNFTT